MHPPRRPTAVDAVADAYFDAVVAASPIEATHLGVPGPRRASSTTCRPTATPTTRELARDTLARLDAVEPVDDVDRVTVAAMRERLGPRRRGPRGRLRPDGAQRHRVAAAGLPRRLRPDADRDPGRLGHHRRPGSRRCRRALDAVDRDPARVGRPRARGAPPAGRRVHRPVRPPHRARRLLRHVRRRGARRRRARSTTPCARDLERGVEAAATAYRRLGDDLGTHLLDRAPEADAVGPRALRARLAPASSAPRSTSRRPTPGGRRSSRGSRPRCVATADRIVPGASVKEAIEHLDHDPRYQLHGTEALREWMQERADEVIADMAGTPLRHPRAGAHHRGRGSPRPTPAASTTRARATTSRGRAGCGGRCPRASPSSAPGAS